MPNRRHCRHRAILIAFKERVTGDRVSNVSWFAMRELKTHGVALDHHFIVASAEAAGTGRRRLQSSVISLPYFRVHTFFAFVLCFRRVFFSHTSPLSCGQVGWNSFAPLTQYFPALFRPPSFVVSPVRPFARSQYFTRNLLK